MMERTTTRTVTKGRGRGGKRRKVGSAPPEEEDVLNLADKIVSIELISREVFRRLDFKDLLNCSLVNRTWRASARLHLRTQRRCFLSFSSKTMKLKQRKFSDLHDLLTNSCDVPFNGVSITSPFQQSSEETSSDESAEESSSDESAEKTSSDESAEKTSSDESAEEDNKGNGFQEENDRLINALDWEGALRRLEVKYLALDWRPEPSSPSSRTAIKEILRRSSSGLVDLTVLDWDWTDKKGLLHYFGVNVLPNVKVLQLPYYERNANAVDLDNLLNALPRLQSLRGAVDLLSLPAFVRKNKQHVIHEFKFSTSSVLELERHNQKAAEEVLEVAITFARSKPKLTKLTLVANFESLSCRSAEKYVRVIEALVRGGAEVLKEITTSQCVLLPLISSFPMSHAQRHSSPLFPAVTNLTICFGYGVNTDFGTTSLKILNLEAHFPLLHSVELDCFPGGPGVLSSDERRTEEYCCKSVRRLVVHAWQLCETGMETACMAIFIKFFPMVRVLVLTGCSNLQGICKSLWGEGQLLWEELRVLRLEGIEEETVRKNWDPLFTGLSKKDCDRLQRQSEPDMQFFKELRLKPREERKGSLLDFKKLEKLQLEMRHDYECKNGRGNAFASTLTGEFVWARQGLRVEIKRRLCQKQLKCGLALNHLQPFVHFVDDFTN